MNHIYRPTLTSALDIESPIVIDSIFKMFRENGTSKSVTYLYIT